MLSGAAERLARQLVHISPAGLQTRIVAWRDVQNRFSATDHAALAESAEELAQEGLISITRGINAPQGIAGLRPSFALFWNYDEAELGYPTRQDAVKLAELLLSDPALGNIPKLHAASGWTLRRFNPALAYVLQAIPERHVSQQIQADYCTAHVTVTAAERVSLERLIEDLKPDRDDAGPNTSLAGRKGFRKWLESLLGHPTWAGISGLLAVAAIAVPFLIAETLPGGDGELREIALTSPPDGAHLSGFPRVITFSWESMPEAAHYAVFVEIQDPPSGRFAPHPFGLDRNVTQANTLLFEFVGDQTGRWWVEAIAADSAILARSGKRRFSFGEGYR